MNRIGVGLSLVLACGAFCAPVRAADVLTYHNDLARTGLNSAETILTPQNVASGSFGLLRTLPVDGQVYAQPLYVSNVAVISGGQAQGSRNLLITVTEHDSVYAFDADSGTLYWQTSVLGNGEVPSDTFGCTDLTPEIGITATPVIDRAAGSSGLVYLLAMSKDANGGDHQRLHAVDLATGQDVRNVEIQATYPGTGPNNDGQGHLVFMPHQERSRAGLLLLNGTLYAEWASYCDAAPYSGWIIAYNASTFAQTAVFNTNPSGLPTSSWLPDGSGGGIWQSGSAPAVDAAGNLYVGVGNGPFDTNLNSAGFPSNGDFGDALLKLSPSLQVLDYFTPFNELSIASQDLDASSGGTTVVDVPDSTGQVHQLAITAGKDANLYVVDRNNFGKFNAAGNNIYQQVAYNRPGAFSSPATFNGFYYFSLVGHALRQLQFTANATLNPVPVSATPEVFGFPGASPAISSSGSTNGIVWAIEYGATQSILHAYDANNLATELYNSASVNFGAPVKFAVPTICNGKVFVGTANAVAVFGRRNPGNQVDLNGDGRSDLVFLNPSRNTVGAWLMNGKTVLATAPLGTIPAGSKLVAMADLANTGSSQLIWFNGSTTYLAWSTTWSANFTPTTTATPFALPFNYPVLIPVDLDGDGLVDVVQFDPASGALLLAKNNGGLAFVTQTTATVAGWSLLGAADLNGNGSHQLLWRNQTTGVIGAWVMTGFDFRRSVVYGTVPLSWEVRGVGKVDATSAEGLIWQNSTTGQVAFWKLNTAGHVTPTGLGVVSAGWQIAANASQNGPDGLPEILWAKPSSGEVGLWVVSGATVEPVILGNPAASWLLQPTPQLH